VTARRRVAAVVLVASALVAGRAQARPPSKSECIASNEAAQDLERAGKLREARAKYAVCVATSCPGAVREDCAQRLEAVGPRIPSLVFDVKDGSGNDVTGVHLGVDGEKLPDALGGTPVEIDPGPHVLTFDADGLPQGRQTVVVTEGDKGRHVHVVLGAQRDKRGHDDDGSSQTAAPAPSASSGASSSDSGSPSSSSSVAPEAASTGSTGSGQRTGGLVLLGAGVVGLGVGSVFGLLAHSTYDHALQKECNGNPDTCSPQGKLDGQSAHTQALVSTVAFAVGGAAALAGMIVYFTAPSGNVNVGANVGGGVAALQVGGRW
jgi:hypothetical protein